MTRTDDIPDGLREDAWSSMNNDAALHAELVALKAAAKNIVGNLPDIIFDWIGHDIGWTNVAVIKDARDKLAALLQEIPEEEHK